jgi:ABC-type nitrate/sulfonate/bicarbonate transport system permease component
MEEVLNPLLDILKTVPGIVACLSVVMVWFEVWEKLTLFLRSLTELFRIYINTAQGFSKVLYIYIRAWEILGAAKIYIFTRLAEHHGFILYLVKLPV